MTESQENHGFDNITPLGSGGLGDEGPISPGRAEELACSQLIPLEVLGEARRQLLGQFKELVKTIEQQHPSLLHPCLAILYQSCDPKGRWRKVERRLEGWTKAHPEWPPKRLAYYAQFYLRFDPRMKPLLIKLARRVKKRLHMREVRRNQ